MYSLLSLASRCRFPRWLAIVVLPLATHATGVTVHNSLAAEVHAEAGSLRIPLIRTDAAFAEEEPPPSQKKQMLNGDDRAIAEPPQKKQIRLPETSVVKRLLLHIKSGADAIELMARRQSRGFQASKRDDRPLVGWYTDEFCEQNTGGYYLPFDASMADSKCAKIEQKDIAKATEAATLNKSQTMKWKCKGDGSAMIVEVHNGNDCTASGQDDTFQFTLDKEKFENFVGSKCTQVINEATVQAEFVKLHSQTHIKEWPECVQAAEETGGIMLACGVVVFLLLLVFLYVKYREYRKRKDKERQMTMGKGYDGFKGAGKGTDFGKGKDMMMMKGKGTDGKGKDMKGKGKKGKGLSLESVDIKMTIVKAEGLRGANGSDKSNPYVECHLNEPNAWTPPFFKTHVKKKTVNPEWKESTEFKGFVSGSWFTLVLKDKNLGNKPDAEFGKAILDYDKVKESGFDGAIDVEMGGVENGKLTLKVTLQKEGDENKTEDKKKKADEKDDD